MIGEYYWTAYTLILTPCEIVEGFLNPTENLKLCWMIKADGLRVTIIKLFIRSTTQVYVVELSAFIFGAFVFATDEQTPSNKKLLA